MNMSAAAFVGIAACSQIVCCRQIQVLREQSVLADLELGLSVKLLRCNGNNRVRQGWASCHQLHHSLY